jgi:hypothetical protein
MKLSMIEEIRKGEEQTQREGILKELKKLPPDIVAEIQRNQLSQVRVRWCVPCVVHVCRVRVRVCVQCTDEQCNTASKR